MKHTIKPTQFGAVLAVLALVGAPVSAQQAADFVAPEAAIALKSKTDGKPVTGEKWMVAVANPHAAVAAANVLREGGSAADAAVAAQAMLGLVEPQSSGLGGGAFVVYYDAQSGNVTTLDGRETAPVEATPTLFQNDAGEPLKFFDAVVGGRSVGTPGTPALMAAMHRNWGKSSWRDLLTPAIERAEKGFQVSPRLAGLVAADAERLSSHPTTAAYFLPNGNPVEVGSTLVNQDYAETLRSLQDGTDVFYQGQIAQNIVRAVRNHPTNPGVLSPTDFTNYTVKERPPVCAAYRTLNVCGMGPPSSGGLTVGQILGLVEPFDLANLGSQNPEAWRLIADASRLAFADRGRYMADNDYVPMPTKGLLKPGYLKARSELLKTNKALETVEPGQPSWDHAHLWGDDQSIELPSTSHFSIVDAEGNAISVTTTIENGFGSRIMVDGFLLNNELTDFSFATHDNGRPIANRVEPGKRPRSSMAPTIVLKDGKPTLVIGSPGGSRIIGYVAKTIIAHIDWGMDIQTAIALPHVVNRFGTLDLEAGTAAEDLKAPMEALGYTVNARSLNSGLHGIAILEDGGLSGGADPRREGIVISDTVVE
ncbi:MAG: gamma-glutamyltransferase [Pseudomonadota bacterium]